MKDSILGAPEPNVGLGGLGAAVDFLLVCYSTPSPTSAWLPALLPILCLLTLISGPCV